MKSARLITIIAFFLAVQAATALATTYSISPNPGSVNENGGSLSFTITRSGGLPAETIYASTTQTEGYTNSSDYTSILNHSKVFALNQTQATVTVSITNDSTVENNETFGLIVQRNSTDPVTTYLAKSTFTIVNDDTLATTYSITPNPATVNENGGTLTFTITRSGGTPTETIYASTTTGEGYANNSDYAGILNQTVSFTSGQTTRTVAVTITNDSTVEPDETFGFIVQRNTTDPVTTYLAKRIFTIVNDDVLVTPTVLSVSPAQPVATGSAQSFTITGTNFISTATVDMEDVTTSEQFYNRSVSSRSGTTGITINPNFGTATVNHSWRVRVNNGSTPSTWFSFTVVPPNISMTDGFDYPIGDKIRYTGASDGDGWYVAMEFNEYYSGNGKYHLGEDWNAESGGNTDYGLPIYSIADGTIIFAGPATVSGWGNVLIIRHKLPDGTLVESLYGHVASFLRTSGTVMRGEQVATIGDGGGLYSAHLHFEVRFSNCLYWGSEGVGYSVTPSPAGWTDPSSFIDAHRPGTGGTILLGVDVSKYNGTVDWNLVRNQGGKTFAFVRATAGKNTTDETFAQNIVGAHNAGLLVGAYHFAYPEYFTAHEEAQKFLSVAGAYIGTGYLPPVLDIEDSGYENSYPYRMGAVALSQWIRDWCSEVEQATGVTGRKVILYTFRWYPRSDYFEMDLNQHPFWVATYPTDPTSDPGDIAPWLSWTFQQYRTDPVTQGTSADQGGTCPGITGGTGYADLDSFNGDLSALQAMANQTPTSVVADLDGDGYVDFVDYAIFANHWMYQNCATSNWCDGTDFDHSGSVDVLDLATFAEYWLEGIDQ